MHSSDVKDEQVGPALTAEPSRHQAFHLWMHHIKSGDFEAAWKIGDKVLATTDFAAARRLPRHLQLVWDGRPIAGKSVLVRCYHGLGDTIQFIRYLPRLRETASEVRVLVQPRLMPLLNSIANPGELVPLDHTDTEPPYDVDLELMELPFVFRSTLGTIPATVPYLHVDAKELERDGHLHVGLVWQSGDWDQRRSLPFELLTPLGAVAGIKIHILQRDALQAGWKEGFGTISGGEDIVDDARVIRGLHLLISVDTMTAHLAGALGVPVWNLLNAAADWRWMQDREDSPWYPTMRLFRQVEPGNWNPVIQRVTQELSFMQAKHS